MGTYQCGYFGSSVPILYVFEAESAKQDQYRFSDLNEKQLGQILSVITKFRNVCAHGERLFTYKTADSIGDLVLHKKLNIPVKRNTYQYGKNDLFAVVISLRYVLPKR